MPQKTNYLRYVPKQENQTEQTPTNQKSFTQYSQKDNLKQIKDLKMPRSTKKVTVPLRHCSDGLF